MSALAKEIRLGKKLSLSLFIATVCLALTWVSMIVALSGAGWSKVSSPERQHWVGLWEECNEYWGCKYLTTGEISSAHRTTQAFVTLSVMSLQVSVIFTLLHVCFSPLRSHLGVAITLLLSRVIAMLFLVVAITVWATGWDKTRYNNDLHGYTGEFHYAFGFAIVALISEFLASIFMAFEVFLVMPKTAKRNL